MSESVETKLATLEAILVRLEQKFEDGYFVTTDRYEARHEALSNRVGKVEETLTWAWRTIVGQNVVVLGGLVLWIATRGQ